MLRTLVKVRSGLLRLKTTVVSSGVSMAPSAIVGFFASGSMIEPSSDEAPLGSAIAMLRSKENFTSEDVSALPLENVLSARRMQVTVCGSSYSHDSAASATGVSPPAGIASSCS